MTALEQLQKLPCKTCGGKKWWIEGEPYHEEKHPCPSCQGTGLSPLALALMESCPRCHGTGKAKVAPRQDEERLRLWGETGDVQYLDEVRCFDPESSEDVYEVCGGTGRVPKSRALRLWEMLEWVSLLSKPERRRVLETQPPHTFDIAIQGDTPEDLLENLAAAVFEATLPWPSEIRGFVPDWDDEPEAEGR